jgi:hypothetical protein
MTTLSHAQAESPCHEKPRAYRPPWHGLQSVQAFFNTLYCPTGIAGPTCVYL